MPLNAKLLPLADKFSFHTQICLQSSDDRKYDKIKVLLRVYWILNSSVTVSKVTGQRVYVTYLHKLVKYSSPLWLRHRALSYCPWQGFSNVTQWRRETGGIYQRRVQHTGVWHQVPTGETWQPFQRTPDSRSPNDKVIMEVEMVGVWMLPYYDTATERKMSYFWPPQAPG